MKKYSSYKNSVVEWIGDIPSHWRKSKFKYVSELQTGNSLNDEQKQLYESENSEEIPYVSSKDIDVDFKTVNYDSGLRIPREDNRFRVSPKGSFLMVIEGGSSGRKMVFLDRDVCYVNKLCSFYSKENTKFQYYFVQSNNYQDKFKTSLSGLIGGVSISNLREFELTLPPLSEQLQIVSFLDTKTSQIDSLIEKTQRKIELLKEKRISLINEVVTKGLNPNVEMKDSGVEWIGEIPSHWMIKKIKHHSEVNVGLVINPSTYFDDNGTVPIITGKNVKVTGIDLGDVDYITEESNELLWKTKIYEGDLVSMRVGYPGRTSVVKKSESGINCCSVIITRMSSSIDSKLLEFQLNSSIGKVQVELCQGGMGQQVVNLSDWNEFNVITPPLSEQNEIVSYLDEQTQLIDKTISVEERRIDTLKEYRQSLISEVVTGKRKVVD